MAGAQTHLLLTLSACLNLVLGCMLFRALGYGDAVITEGGRRLDTAGKSDGHDRMQDCASVACPAYYEPSPAIEVGSSTMVPMIADTRYRLHGPKSMLELTQLIYGQSAVLGDPFHNFSNPFGRKPDLNYAWTQITEKKLEEAFALLPDGGRNAKLFVEVGSFVGRSSVLIGNWLRKREERLSNQRRSGIRTGEGAAIPLLCIDTWSGDVGMTLGQICASGC